jgi:hypothetical protein
MKTIKISQGYQAIVDDEDYEMLSEYAWAYCRGYAQYSNGETTVFMHRIVARTPNGLCTDHINGNKLDNRKSNLRSVTYQQNQFNRKKQKQPSSSKYKGVSWLPSKKSWKASIKISGKLIYLGLFKDEPSAATAYNQAAERHFGVYALVNQIGG